MDVSILEDIGLTKPLAAAYTALIEHGPCGAPTIATRTGESRSNAYKLLDRLCELELASKSQAGKKIIYYPANPTALERLIERDAAQVALRERKLKAAMPDLVTAFVKSSEQPGIRFFQGRDGLKQIYEDQIKTNQPLYYIRSTEDVRFFDLDELHAVRNTLPKHGIPRRAITQDITPRSSIPPEERTPIAESDKAMLLTRTWIDPEDYSEPVEWAVYGDKLSIISYGKEAIGTVIDSPQIAAAFRRIFTLLEEGIRRRPGYHLRPLRTTYTARPERLKKNPSKNG